MVHPRYVPGGGLDLGGAGAHTAALEHVVATTVEVEVAVAVEMPEVPGVQPHLAGVRIGPEARGGQLGRPPVPGHHVRSADHDLARLAGCGGKTVRRQDADACAVERAAYRTGPAQVAVDLQYGDPLALRGSVHQLDARAGKVLAQLGTHRSGDLHRCW